MTIRLVILALLATIWPAMLQSASIPDPAATAAATLAAPPLRIGVAPHTSARVILTNYQPLRDWLQSRGFAAEIETAPDFTEFARRALDSQYDIAITTGHQARLLQSDGGYLPLLTYRAEFRPVVVVAAGDPIATPRDLSETTILGLSPTSLVSQWGLRWLADNGVTGTSIRHVSAADSVAHLILTGQAAAGFMSTANFHGLPPDSRQNLRLFAEGPAMLGRVYMLAPRLAARRAEIQQALQDFAATAPAQDYFQRTGLEGYRLIGTGELEAMEPYAEEARAILRQTPPRP